jgi:RNA polymerase sigma-70 factor (ECF subfamily)
MDDRPPGDREDRKNQAARLHAALAPHLAGLRAFLKRDTGDAALADDLLHDAIVTALEKLATGELSDPDRLPGFVYKTALNHWRNHRRKHQRLVGGDDAMAELQDESAAGAPAESLHAAQWTRIMRNVLRELPAERDRELLVRFYLNQEDKDELCTALGVSPAHFNRVAFRARERLHALLSSQGFTIDDLFWAAVLVFCVSSGLPPGLS